MIYTQKDGTVWLEMTQAEYDQLTVMLGVALGYVSRDGDTQRFYHWLAFVNELNRTNPRYTPYAIPADYMSGRSESR